MIGISCPVCQTTLREVVRGGILIDVCMQCKGVWLDRGELKKLLAMSRSDPEFAGVADPAPHAGSPRPETREPNAETGYARSRYRGAGNRFDSENDARDHYRPHPAPLRKKSKLETLFDVFD